MVCRGCCWQSNDNFLFVLFGEIHQATTLNSVFGETHSAKLKPTDQQKQAFHRLQMSVHSG
jgi:hypothetical protein